MKKLLSIVLMLALLLSIVPMQVFAATSGDYTYTLDGNNNATITGYTGKGGNITIPSTLDGHPVTVIGKGAFSENESLTSVIIPNGVTAIADSSDEYMVLDGAFTRCMNLTSVTLPNTLTYIGTHAFQACRRLKSITIPSGVTTITHESFQDCEALTSLILPNGLTSIGDDAFGACFSLTAVTIPNSVVSLGRDAFLACEKLTSINLSSNLTYLKEGSPFGHCYKLTAINVDSKNPNYASEAGVLYNKNKTRLMQYPSNKAGTSFTIPSSVTIMDNTCFMFSKNLKSIIIPNTVTKISDGEFLSCSSLTSLVIPSSVTYIDNFAFNGCNSLASLTIPPSVTDTGSELFSGCPANMKIVGVAGSNAQNLANGYDVYTFVAVNASTFTPIKVPKITEPATPATIDWNTIPAISTATGQSATTLKVTLDANFIYLCAQGSGFGPHVNFYLDMDNTSATGYIENKWLNTGIDYMIEGGDLYRHMTNDAEWTWENYGKYGVKINYGPTMYEVIIPKYSVDGLVSTFKVGVKDMDKDWNVLSRLPLTGELASYTIQEVKSGTGSTSTGATEPMTVSATPTNSKVLVNGVGTAFEAYNIGGSNYFKLRDIAKVVSGSGKQFEVTYDSAKKAINLMTNKPYTANGSELIPGNGAVKAATLNTSTIYKDGVVIELTAYTINGNNFFKLRDLAKAFNIGVTWDGTTKTLGIDTALSYTE